MEFIIRVFNHHIIRYIFSGGMGAIVNLGLLYILTDLVHLHYLVSGIIAFICAVIVSFFMQKKWTFKDHSTENTHKKFGVFVIVAVVNLALNTALLYFFTDFWHWHYMVSQFFAAAIVAVWSYFIYKIVFKKETIDSSS